MAGKPHEGEPRSARVLLRVLPAELSAWKREAARAGLSLSAWIRKLANDAIKRARSRR